MRSAVRSTTEAVPESFLPGSKEALGCTAIKRLRDAGRYQRVLALLPEVIRDEDRGRARQAVEQVACARCARYRSPRTSPCSQEGARQSLSCPACAFGAVKQATRTWASLTSLCYQGLSPSPRCSDRDRENPRRAAAGVADERRSRPRHEAAHGLPAHGQRRASLGPGRAAAIHPRRRPAGIRRSADPGVGVTDRLWAAVIGTIRMVLTRLLRAAAR